MENWDPQMMLDMYIHNYLIRKNMHSTAEIFAREANVFPKAVAIDSPEGLLSEWWSVFWSIYSPQTQATPSAMNVPQNVHPAMPNPGSNYMLQNTSLAMQPGLPNLLQTVCPTTMRMPNMGSFLPSNISPMMSTAEMEFSFQDLTMTQEQAIQNLTAAGMGEQHYPIGDSNSGSELLNVDQLASMLSSPSNPSHLQERVYKNPQLSFTRDDPCATYLRRYSANPTRHLPNDIQLEVGAADTGSKMFEQEHLGSPGNNLTSNPHFLDVDQLACLLPSSSNCSQTQDKFYTNLLLSDARDDQSGSNLWDSVAADPYSDPPKSIQFNMEPAVTEARMHEQDFVGLPVRNLNSNTQDLHVDQFAPSLPSSTCSHPQKNKKRRHSVTGDDKCGASLRRSINAVPTHYAPIPIQPKNAKQCEQGHLTLPVRDLNSNSQLVDVNQLARLLSASSNYSQPQRNVDKKSQPSLTRDERCNTVLRRSIVHPTCHALKAIQSKPDASNTGSSTSSNSAKSDPGSRIQELMPTHEAARTSSIFSSMS